MFDGLSTLFRNLGGLFTWWVMINPWSQGLRIRLGKHVKKVGSGIHLKIPGIDKFVIKSIRLRTIDLGIQTITTADGKTVTVAGNISFTIVDVEKLFNTLHNAEDTIADFGMSAIAKYIAVTESNMVYPEAVADHATRSISLSDYGLGNAQLNITDFAFVKTYRFIKDDRRYFGSPSLETHISSRDD